jgi:N-methylhydantoinase B
VEVFKHLFAAVASEMGATLQRSAFSPNIVERRDYSCALFDGEGRMIGQAAHLPVHLGSAPRSVQAAIRRGPLRPGDAVLLNDPYAGGTHLPDLTLVSPVWLPGRRAPSFHVACRAHHADVGGPYPGSMGPAQEIYAEGLRLPPLHLVRGGELDPQVLELLLANMRGAREREGDLLAQWSANRLGVRRLGDLAREYGAAALEARAADQCTWTAELARARLAQLPAGTASVVDQLDLSGTGLPPAQLRLTATVAPSGLALDFSATDEQLPAPYNAPRAVLESAVFYVVRCLLPAGTPACAGVLEPVELTTRPGTLVDARSPAPVAAGNVETSQRLVDLLLAALDRLAPGVAPAASAGTMSNLTFGPRSDRGDGSTWYETHAGGAGASAGADGEHAVQCHMTNTRNTPIEAFERERAARVMTLTVRRGSGGLGRHRGGDGLVKQLLFLEPVRVGWLADRQSQGPPGAAGGRPGAPGRAQVREGRDGPWRTLGAQGAVELPAGGEVRVETPGGGGFGPHEP